ncbi:Fe-S cluster assembly protein IscX [Stenoxybacter acetivorans]|uniref:Fe-S cluster assembly protein IscX n=1 Tax=Stenoxybacter acetivorans TaxID=422441 RepID=UPI000564CEBD|nr:Fe-S cluster assembly protein IscX [Stenoxybacter acetivorans]
MKWTDVYRIAESLADAHSDIHPQNIRFTELRALVLGLPEFDDNPDHCGEKVLEAIQQAWIEEIS